jgi:hypothetical protein
MDPVVMFFVTLLLDDDNANEREEEELFLQLLVVQSLASAVAPLQLQLKLFQILYPGRGNFIRGPNHYDLTNFDQSWSRFGTRTINDSAFETCLGVSLGVFEELSALMEPWFNLPRHFSEGFLKTGADSYVFHSQEFYEVFFSFIPSFVIFHFFLRLKGILSTQEKGIHNLHVIASSIFIFSSAILGN